MDFYKKTCIHILFLFIIGSFFVIRDAEAFVCGTDTVTYGGLTYNTVQIGNQCWFRQNLNVGSRIAITVLPDNTPPTLNNPATVQKWCYNNSDANCTTYGGLYSWAEANAFANSCNTASCTPSVPNQGICPTGWHIPTHNEFTTLERAVCTSGTCVTDFPFDTTTMGWRGTNEGTKLKTVSATDFSSLLAGDRNSGGGCGGLGTGAYFWAASQISTTDAWYRNLTSTNTTTFRYSGVKTYGLSVRCIRNTVAPSVTTSATTNITSTSATGNGNITDVGGESSTRYIQWGTTSGSYTSSCSAGSGGSGAFSCSMTSLSPNTIYYVRAYATNSAGTGYGLETSFTTPTLPVITINNPNTSPAQSKTITASTNKGTLTQSITTGATCDGSLTFSAYSSITFTQESDNGKKVCYRSVDVGSGTSYALSNAIAGIDTTNPTIFANNNSSNWQTIDPAITLSTHDDISLNYSKYTWDSDDNTCRTLGTSFSNNDTINITTEGTHTLYLCNQDTATNTNSWSGTYKLDTQNPTITSVTSDCSNITDPHFTITANDNTSGLDSSPYSFDGGNTWQAQNDKTYTDFNHTIPAYTIKVKDVAGNITTYESSAIQSCVQNPTVTTQATTLIRPTDAQGNGTVTDTGGEDPERQIEWGTTSGNYTNSCTAGTGTTGQYSCQMTNLTPQTTYYVRAKVTNSANTTYGDETQFTTLPATLTIPDPDTNKITNAVNNGYIFINDGTITNTTEAQTATTITMTTDDTNITFPQNTTITGDGDFNFQNFTAQNITSTVRQEQPNSRVAIDLGISNEQLSFGQDITLQIYVGTPFNDLQMEVLYQNDGETTWNINELQPTCTVSNGYCTFQTNHATIYTINGIHTQTGDAPMNINVEVQDTLSMDCFDPSDNNTTVQIGTTTNPGTVTAGTPAIGQSQCTVTTNDDQGYYLTIQDNNQATHTTLTHTDPNTGTIYEISDLTQYNETTPVTENWTAPTTKGLGFSITQFPQTDTSHNTLGTIWTNTNQCPEGTNPDTNDYAGIPDTPQAISAVTAYQATATTTQVCYKVDVPPSQPSGQYTGEVTFTATSDASGYYQ
jgi:uncharacterized protein (TIGR02145 family)